MTFYKSPSFCQRLDCRWLNLTRFSFSAKNFDANRNPFHSLLDSDPFRSEIFSFHESNQTFVWLELRPTVVEVYRHYFGKRPKIPIGFWFFAKLLAKWSNIKSPSSWKSYWESPFCVVLLHDTVPEKKPEIFKQLDRISFDTCEFHVRLDTIFRELLN